METLCATGDFAVSPDFLHVDLWPVDLVEMTAIVSTCGVSENRRQLS